MAGVQPPVAAGRRARRPLAASLAAVVAQAAGAKVRVTDMLVRWDADDAQPSAEAGADALKAFLLSKVNKGS